MFSQIKDRKHIEYNFHSVVGVMPQGWNFGVLGGGEKTLAWGFGIAPHRLRVLVRSYEEFCFKLIVCQLNLVHFLAHHVSFCDRS